MNIEYITRSEEVDDRFRQLIEKKLSRLEKYFRDIIDVQVQMTSERHTHKVQLYIKGANYDVRSHAEGGNLKAAFQSAFEKLDLQARKAKTKFKERRRGEIRDVPDWAYDVLDSSSVASGEPRIVETSAITVKPMSIDEARMQLEGSKQEFIVFLNADSDKVNVLYRRRDANLGLITPEL